MGEEVLEAVVDESDGLAPVCGSCRCKTVSQGSMTVELEQFQCSLPPGSVSTHSGQCGVPTIAARSISHRSTQHQPSRHAASAIATRCVCHRGAFEFPLAVCLLQLLCNVLLFTHPISPFSSICFSLPLILLSRMPKVYGITFLKLWENRSLWYRIPKTFAIFAVDN